eukprot:CAMPEP_0172331620 /NCGR_PEP_ID=MMETSP1058-20130122/62017_1 /TAXON_ID=83371 /ORGANISM="Detonula confervacea, Strain CCMP 353" /LENGTH=726 /DNA_ID=CAMNT_0013048889 /DNA_START=121 /DNA_END=2301 /DNA_ORIENTATION=-
MICEYSEYTSYRPDPLTVDRCPAVIRKAVGIYSNSSNNNNFEYHGFENVLLMVSANFGYLDFLLNWGSLATMQGLKYGIVAMDDQLYEHFGALRAVRSDTLMTSSAAAFRKKEFNDISCNKLTVVLDIMEKCDVDVVFSDVDNVFLQDPFRHDLGRLIKMQAYDYIYQANDLLRGELLPRTSHDCLRIGEHPNEANTGFYYLSRKATAVKDIFRRTIDSCANNVENKDDQVLFWREMNKEHEKDKLLGTNSSSWHHCSNKIGYDTLPDFDNEGSKLEEKISSSIRLCCMDPFYYPVGILPEPEHQKAIITYHANYAVGKDSKIAKMKSAGGWNPEGSEAIDLYMKKVESVYMKKNSTCNNNNARVAIYSNMMDDALSCLHKTSPLLMLEYPADADAHMNEIRLALAPWAQHTAHVMSKARNYGGPWIENHWISHFESLYDDGNSTCASDIFGPFIPIFIPFVDHWVNLPRRYHYPERLIDVLQSVLRPNVLYITVSQNDEGLPGKNEFDMATFPNVMVLSAGGYGHVPLPLFKQPESLNNQKQLSQRSIFLSYVGSLANAPRDMRSSLHKQLTNTDSVTPGRNDSNTSNSTKSFYKYFYGNEWRDIMADSQFSLCPRGYGRTSYHLVETLQMGLIPIHVFSDVPWVPYAGLFEEIGYVSHSSQIESLVNELQGVTKEQLEKREQRIVSLLQSHFSIKGVMQQIEHFMKGDKNDLRCQALPLTIRDS